MAALPLGDTADGIRHRPAPLGVVGELPGRPQLFAEGLHARGVVGLVLVVLAVRGQHGAAGDEGEVLIGARLQRVDPRVIEHIEGLLPVHIGVLQFGPRDRVPHAQPQQQHRRRGGRGEQPMVEDPVGPAVVAPLRPEQRTQRNDTETQREERPRSRGVVVLVEPAGLRRVQPLGGRQQLGGHLLVRVPQIGAAQRQPLPVVGAGPLDQAGVPGEFLVELGDLLARRRRRVRGGRRLHQQPGRVLDVLLVPLMDIARLLRPREEPAGRRRVGIGQRTVDVRRLGAQRLTAAHHVVGGGRPAGDLERRHGPERNDEHRQRGPDDLEPARFGRRRSPQPRRRPGPGAATRRGYRHRYGRGRLGRRVLRRRAHIRRVCHVTSPSVADGGPPPGRSGDWCPARSMAAGTDIHTRNTWILHRATDAHAFDQGRRRRSRRSAVQSPKRTDLPIHEHVRDN